MAERMRQAPSSTSRHFASSSAGRFVVLPVNTGGEVELLLSDIGWERILIAVQDAMPPPRA
jgi:hypothetical protein